MIDETDRKIIAELQRDGRCPLEQVARAVNLSRSAVHDRVRRLESKGLIRRYTVQVDWPQLGYPLTAFISLRTKVQLGSVLQQILQRSVAGAVVEECYRITGDYCLLLKVRAASTLTLQDQLDTIRAVAGVDSTHTTIALSSIKEGAMDDDSATVVRIDSRPVLPGQGG